jgi:hypothetical protein
MKLFTLTRDAAGTAHVLMTSGSAARVLHPKSWGSGQYFEWGYGGTGPARLAFTILSEVAGREVAAQFDMDFMRELISNMPKEGGTISETEVRLWLKGRGKEAPVC